MVASVFNVGWHVFVGMVLGLFGAGLFVAAFQGVLPAAVTFIVAIGFILFMLGAGLVEGLQAFKARPRGLGQRRVRKWKDGSPYYEWEKY